MSNDPYVVSLKKGTMSPNPQQPRPRRRARKVLVVLLLLLVSGGVLGVGGWYAYSWIAAERVKNREAPQEVSASSTTPLPDTGARTAELTPEEAVAAVAKLIDLPQDEQPTVATVTDPALLKDQPFFARAKNGDIVLLYTNAKKAYLYDPVANRLKEVSPISTSPTE